MVTQSAVCDNQKSLNAFLQAFDQFPSSTNKSTMLYDHQKLLFILRDKELRQLCSDAELVEEAQRASVEFGKLLPVVNQDAVLGINDYHKLEELTLKEFNGFLYIYVKQWAISIKALYYYKTGSLNLAQSLSLECIAFNDLLIHEGLFTLVLRSAEQNRNLARVMVARKEIEKGSRLAGDVLDYLLNGKPGSLYGNIFKNIYYWNQNSYAREGYSYEIFRGLVNNIISLNNPAIDQKTLFTYYFENLSFDLTSPDRLIIHEWLEIKKVLYYGNRDTFIELAVLYMKRQTTKLYDVLKISLIQDLEHIFFEDRLLDLTELKQQISSYLDGMTEYSYLKRFLKSYGSTISHDQLVR